MSLKINSIKNDGDAKEEYVLLQATAKVNLIDYAVVDRTFDKDGQASNIHKHYYRFPDQVVEKDEYVAVRTKKGTYNKGQLTGGETVHRFYWGSDAPIWNDENVEQAELLKVSTVEKFTIGRSEKPKLNLRPNNLKYGGKK